MSEESGSNFLVSDVPDSVAQAMIDEGHVPDISSKPATADDMRRAFSRDGADGSDDHAIAAALDELREEAKEKRRLRGESDPSDPDADDGIDQVNHAPEAPSHLRTPEAIQQAARWLQNCVNEVQRAWNNGQISEQEYQQLHQVIEGHAVDIRQADLALRENAIKQQHEQALQIEAHHRAIADHIPEWSDPKEREGIVNELVQFYSNAGIPHEILNMVTDPQTIRVARDLMRQIKTARQKESKQLRALAKQRQQARDNARDGGRQARQVDKAAQFDEIARMFANGLN